MREHMPDEIIENRIFVFRGHKVMIDRDLAELYGVKTMVLNQAVKRNVERFPEGFMFQLNIKEKNELITICDRFAPLKHSSQLVSSRVCAFIASLTISSSLPRPIPVPAQ